MLRPDRGLRPLRRGLTWQIAVTGIMARDPADVVLMTRHLLSRDHKLAKNVMTLHLLLRIHKLTRK